MDKDIKNGRKRVLRDVCLGDHLCLIYESREEQFYTAIPFIEMGLRNNEKCTYIANENSIEEITKAMNFLNEELFTKSLQNGSLAMLTKSDSYLKEGYFDPDKMINFLREDMNKSIEQGHSGIRVTGEMTWMLAGDPGSEKLMEYESKLNNFLPGSKTCALCQYNRNKFSEEIMLNVFRTHPLIIYKNRVIKNWLYMAPEEFEKSPKEKLLLSHIFDRLEKED